MALTAYLSMKGATQGDILGSSTVKGREDKIEIFGWSHEIISPRDATTGKSVGKLQHTAIEVTKALDKSSPKLMNVLVNNENLTDFQLELWQPSPTGEEVQHYTITLDNASVSEIRSEQLNNKYPENMAQPVYETVSFTYQKITCTWEEGGVTSDDNWESTPSPG